MNTARLFYVVVWLEKNSPAMDMNAFNAGDIHLSLCQIIDPFAEILF
jgi:hypothetical protein